jgi:hypothetical protein
MRALLPLIQAAVVDGICIGVKATKLATAPVWVAVWDDDNGERQAQVYETEDAARRDFPGAGSEPSIVNVLRSTVQQ